MNEHTSYTSFRARAVRMPRWQIAIIGALAATLVITLAVFATAVFLLVFPAMILLDWFYRWRAKNRRDVAAGGKDTVITADYEVLPPDSERRER